MRKDSFPSKEEFYKTILRLKKEREIKREGEYLGYLKEQKRRRKSRKLKNGIDKVLRRY